MCPCTDVPELTMDTLSVPVNGCEPLLKGGTPTF